MKFNRILALAVAVCLAVAFVGCQAPAPAPEPSAPAAPSIEPAAPSPEVPEPAGVADGTYSAVCKGFYGDFDVSVTIENAAITDIAVGEHKETAALGGKAITLLKDAIIANNTSGVDSVSGATITSAVFKAAVKDCLSQADAPDAMLAAPELPAAKDETVNTDVLVIGAGAAGFSAAIEAAQAGATVTLIEKQDIVGGSTVTSAGIVYAAVDKKDYAKMTAYYMQRAGNKADKALLQYFAENSLDTIAFLDGLGVKWMMTVPAGTAPEARARFSMHEDGRAMIGSSLIDPMEAKAVELGVTIMTGVTATELTVNADGAVTGAKAQSKAVSYSFQAKAVVLATGGFDASKDMKAKYAPNSVTDFPLSSKGNTGDGINMGIAVGAATVFNGGMIGFELVDGSLPDSGYNGVAMGSAVFVQTDGTFVALGADYPINYTNLKVAGGETFFGLYDAAGAENAQRALDVGYGFKGDTIEALAKASGMDAAKLADSFAKNPALATAPYFAVVVKPCTIGSMGGLKINTNAEVLSEAAGAPLPGLYAAGEVANGGFYYMEYPASGSSNSLAITYGRQAGKNAAAFAKK